MPSGVRRIARAIVVALVKRQKPRLFTVELGAEFYTDIVHRKMHHTTLELEQQILRVTVGLVLIHRIVNILLCEFVFEFAGDYRQPVDKDA